MASEQLTHWLKIGEVALIASVKFLLAPFESERQGFNFGESFTITTIGGAIGILVFYYAGAYISTWWRHFMALIKSVFLRKPPEVIERKKKKKNFTRGRRFIVGVKTRFGLAGVAFVTPSLISIPIGSMVAAQFFRKRKPVLLYLFTALVFWSLVLNGIAQYVKLSQYIPHGE
jgi:hypothetical protein